VPQTPNHTAKQARKSGAPVMPSRSSSWPWQPDINCGTIPNGQIMPSFNSSTKELLVAVSGMKTRCQPILVERWFQSSQQMARETNTTTPRPCLAERQLLQKRFPEKHIPLV